MRMMPRERRGSPRVPFDEDVIVYAGGRRMACRGLDLSTSGIGLLPEESARLGLHVIVDMGLGGSESIAVEGYVVRQERLAERYAWGVQFHSLSPRVERKLDAHIAEVAREGAHHHHLRGRPLTPHTAQRGHQNLQPALHQVKRRRPELPDLPERRPTPSSVVLPAMPTRRPPTPILDPVRPPTPAPAPAFEIPAGLVNASERPKGPRAEPSPAFAFAPAPAPALPRHPRQLGEQPKAARSLPALEPPSPTPSPKRPSANSVGAPNLGAQTEPKPRQACPSPAPGGAAMSQRDELQLDVHQRETAYDLRDSKRVASVDDSELSDEALEDFVNEFIKD